MNPTVRGNERSGWRVEWSYTAEDEPVLITVSWRVLHTGRTDPLAPALADGLHVRANCPQGR